MKNHDKQKFMQIFTVICGLYKHSVNEMIIEIYWQSLEGFEIDVVKQAFQAHIKHPDKGQFMPKPADLLRYIQGDSETQALQAWSRVLQVMRNLGSNNTLVFDDAILHQVIEDMGGWIRLSELTTKEMDFQSHVFKIRYVAYMHRPPETYPRQLTGRFDRHNSQWGYQVRPPVLIGDIEKAKQIYQQGHVKGLHQNSVAPLLSFDDAMFQTKLLADEASAPSYSALTQD